MAAEAPTEPPAPEPRRMRLRGLHHVTLICRDLERTTAFYRDLLGLALVSQATNPDDPAARHFWFGDEGGAPGTLISFLEYPSMDPGVVGSGSTHHLALAVESADELLAWREYLRDPDGHMLEIATLGPGFGTHGPDDVPAAPATLPGRNRSGG